MLLPYYMISFILESSISFSILYNCVAYNYNIYDYFITNIISPLYFVTCVTVICNIKSHLCLSPKQ